MEKLEHKFNILKNNPSDINQHLETLRLYSSKSQHVTEMGVRGVISTYALLYGNPSKGIVSYDIVHPSEYGGTLQHIEEFSKEYNIPYEFKVGDSLKVIIDPTDLLFIDTWHTYNQLFSELNLHSGMVSKYIILHDTTSFAHHGETLTAKNTFVGEVDQTKGLWDAVEEFLKSNSEWSIHERFTHNNGLTVLKRTK